MSWLLKWFSVNQEDDLPNFIRHPFVRYAILAIATVIFFQFEIVSSITTRIVVYTIWIVVSLIIAINAFSGAEKKEERISVLDEYHEHLKRAIRKIKAKGNYDQLRHRVVAAKIKLNQLNREHAPEEEINEATNKLEQAQQEIFEFETKDTDTKVNVFDFKRFKYEVSTPAVPGGHEVIQQENATLESVKNLIDQLKESKRGNEKKLVTENYMPFTGFIALTILFVTFAVSELVFDVFWDNLFLITRTFGLSLLVFIIWYIYKSRGVVERTDKGVKFFKQKPYAIVSRGPRLTIWPFVEIEEISTEVQRFDLASFKAKIADWKDKEKRSQIVHFNVSVLFHIERPIDAITELGTSFVKIIKKLTGDPDGQSQEERLGIIGDHVQSFIRSFVAEWIRTLDNAYQVQDDIAFDLRDSLKENLEYLGIRIDNVFVTDVRGEEEIEQARNKRELAHIQFDTSIITKDTTIVNAEAEAEKAKKIGEAQALVKKEIGFAEAAITKEMGKRGAEVIEMEIKAKIRAMKAISPEAQKKAEIMVPFIVSLLVGDKVLPQIAEGLKGMNLNLYSFSDISEAVKNIAGAISGIFSIGENQGGSR